MDTDIFCAYFELKYIDKAVISTEKSFLVLERCILSLKYSRRPRRHKYSLSVGTIRGSYVRDLTNKIHLCIFFLVEVKTNKPIIKRSSTFNKLVK
jgi:hypothetical protein